MSSTQEALKAPLEAGLRERFFAANLAGSEGSFKRLLSGLSDAELTRRTEAARDREVEAQAAK